MFDYAPRIETVGFQALQGLSAGSQKRHHGISIAIQAVPRLAKLV
jgi:hypothetical protein